MGTPKKVLHFILFSSLFIGCCAVAFCMETNILLGLPWNNVKFYIFVFAATLTQYSFHYLIKSSAVAGSDRLQWSMHNRMLHFIFLIIGVVLLINSLFSFYFYHFFIILCLGIVALLYSFPLLPFAKGKRIKDFGSLKFITLSLLWTLVTVWFPVDSMPYEAGLYAIVFVKRFLFMMVLCLLFDMRDVEIDRSENINTPAVVLGLEKSYKFSYLLLALFIVMSIIQYLYYPHLGFLLAMVCSAAATYWVIGITKKYHNDVVYLAGVDGMMLLQFLLVYAFAGLN